jgi:hypothetical protein
VNGLLNGAEHIFLIVSDYLYPDQGRLHFGYIPRGIHNVSTIRPRRQLPQSIDTRGIPTSHDALLFSLKVARVVESFP